jgi:hypothetical protein
MLDADRIAEQHQTLEGYTLADYRAVAIPYYVIYVDAVILERQPLAAITEFLLRAIKIGLTSIEDIRQFLGVEARFFNRLIGELCDDAYIARSGTAALEILARGDYVLANCYEAIPQEKEVPLVWDLLQKRPAGYVETLIREADAKRDGLFLIRARPMRAPVVGEIPLHAVQSSWINRQRGVRSEESEVIRLRQARRRLLRYRPAVGLVYVPEKGADVRVRFAINGKIDEVVSQGFAEQDGARHMGIASEFGKKATTLAIRMRLKELPGEMVAVTGYADLLKKRAVARLGLDSLRRRMQEQEEDADELERRVGEKEIELSGIEGSIKKLPFRELMPYEVIQLTKEALQKAQKRVVITTRIPSRERLTSDIVTEIKRAAEGGAKVSIYLAGRVPSDGGEEKRWSAIRELDKLASAPGSIEVAFLVELKRSIFEVVVDESVLLVCNRPPLGDATNVGAGFHPFAGVVTTDHLAIRAYVAAHLSPDVLTVTKRFAARIAGSSRSSVSNRGQSVERKSPHRPKRS